MPINRLGLSQFLAHAFLSTSGTDLSQLNILKLLNYFEAFGQIACKRKRSNVVLDTKHLQ